MLDYRLNENESNLDANRVQEDNKTLGSALPPPAPKPPAKSIPLWRWLLQRWDDLSFRGKLTILLLLGTAIPTIAVTQIIENTSKTAFLAELNEVLDKDLKILEQEVFKQQALAQTSAANLAAFVEANAIDLNNPQVVSQYRPQLQKLQEIAQADQIASGATAGQSFEIITDAQGKVISADVEILVEDFAKYPKLPTAGSVPVLPKFRQISLPLGVNLGNIPIVKAALTTQRPLAGTELLTGTTLQSIGLLPQAQIGIRTQPIKGLPAAKQPAPAGTYDIDQGKMGLAIVAVQPIKVNNRIVGSAIIGTLLNRNTEIVDQVSYNYQIPLVTLFAQDWRISTTVPYTDKQTRAIGTKAASAVSNTVLKQGKDYIGEANIIGADYATGYGPLWNHQKQLNPSQAKPIGMVFVGEPLEQALAPLRRQQVIAYSIGGGMLLLAGLVALPLASYFARPLRRLTDFAEQVGTGEKGVRLEATERRDEIGVLSQELNKMAMSIDASFENQQQEAERARVVKEITVKLGQFPQTENILNAAVEEIRLAIKSDRVIVYAFNENWQGTIISESVGEGFPVALGAQIHDPCFADRYVEKYRQGRVQATANIYEAGLTECHLKQLEPFAVKANLVAPILQNKQLLGLLIAHQCDAPRVWQPTEIDVFAQLAIQVGYALDRANLLEQQKSAKEQLQKRALELLIEVDPVSRGDLTIRANVTEDEIGTVADSYNATIGSLRRIVTQVQTAAKQLATTTSSNEASVQGLSQEALRQAEEITEALDRIQDMSTSIRAVAKSAEQAEAAIQLSTQTVEEGDAAMNRTVDGILAIRETVAETSKKVKRLGESSQKISKVVNLIGTFAEQTNLLALNAAIEAANAGEQGRGFAVVADRVRGLARQSAQATAEIENLVKDIQTETNEVVAAMEAGTEQVVTGTKLVDETRQSLTKIAEASSQINELVKAIAQSAVEQSQTSEEVTQTMTDVAAIATKTSTEVTTVSDSFKELLAVANELQASASQFKVN